jgi:haloalkane dehalogenase
MRRTSAPILPEWLARELPFERYMVDVGDGYRMHVMEQGEGLPVLLLHGNPSWGYLYRHVARELRDAPLRLIMPDLIGLGLSDKPRSGRAHRLSSHVRWMSRLIAALELDRCVMGVQDWGGAVGVGALAQSPSVTPALLVMNTVLTPPKRGFRPTPFHRFSHLPVVSNLAFRLQLPVRGMTLAQGDRGSIRGDVLRAYRYPLSARHGHVAPLALARMAPNNFAHPSIAPLEQCANWVKGFDGPAAIVWGDRDPVLGSVLGWMKKLFPQAPVTRTQAGHFLQEEVPGDVAEAIRGLADTLTGDA